MNFGCNLRMILGNNLESITNNFEIPLSSYSKNLITLLKGYLDEINNDSLLISSKATEKAKITL